MWWTSISNCGSAPLAIFLCFVATAASQVHPLRLRIMEVVAGGGGGGGGGSTSPRGDAIDYDKVLKTGYLQKKKSGKNWKRRYCMLTQHHLVYFEDQEAKNNRTPQGVIYLVNAAVKMATTDRVEAVQLICPQATYFFDAQSAEQNKAWFDQIDFTLRNMRSGGNLANTGAKFVYDDPGPASTGSQSPLSLSSSSVGCAIEGNLRKQGNQKLVKDWKIRYFVLTEMGSLLYYKQKGDPQPLGVIKMQNAKAKLAPETGKEFAFSVDTGDRIFRMQAANATEMGRWIDAVGRAARGGSQDLSSVSSREMNKSNATVRQSPSNLMGSGTIMSLSSGALSGGGSSSGKSGYLMKMGNNVRGKSDWKQRWFVLEGDNLRYYPTEQSDEMLGNIKLVTASAVASDLRERCVQIITPNRKYYVQAPTDRDAAEWLEQINAARNASGNSAVAQQSEEVERVLSGVLKKQGNNTIKDWRERYCVMNATTFRYYKSDKAPAPLGEVNLLMASAKDEGNNRFSLVLPSRKYVFEAKSPADLQRWMKGIQDNTVNLYNNLKAGDSSKKKDSKDVSKFAENKERVLSLMSSVPGNNECADCSKPNPRWASVNLGVFICLECSGIHRSLGVHISKVRSADLDEWEDWQLENMTKKGNRAQNEVYEWKGVAEIKPGPEASAVERDRYIRQKWAVQAFADPSRVEKVSLGSSSNNGAGVAAATPVAPRRLYREGWLTKQGHKRKNWKRRWFVCREEELCYYENRGAEEPSGRILLHEAAVEAMPAGGPFPFMFRVIVRDVVYAIYAQDEKERVEWIETIDRAIRKCRNDSEIDLDDDDDDEDEFADAASALTASDGGLDGQAILNGKRDKEGTLSKMGDLYWTKRYFVLSQGDLYYFTTDTMEIAGVIILKGASTKAVAQRSDRTNCFLIMTAEKAYLFSAESPDAVKQWMDAITNAVNKPSKALRSLSLSLTPGSPNGRDSDPAVMVIASSSSNNKTSPVPVKSSGNPAARVGSMASSSPASNNNTTNKPSASPRGDLAGSMPAVSPRKPPPTGGVSVMPVGTVMLKKTTPSQQSSTSASSLPAASAQSQPQQQRSPPSARADPPKAASKSKLPSLPQAPPKKKPLPEPGNSGPPRKALPPARSPPVTPRAAESSPPAAALELSSSGFGLLGLDAPEDLDEDSDDANNPYAMFSENYSAVQEQLENEEEEEELIY